MKKKFICVCVLLGMCSLALAGCGNGEEDIAQSKETVLTSVEKDVLESNVSADEETDFKNTEISFNEWGYTYKTVPNNGVGSIKTVSDVELVEKEAGEEITEVTDELVLSWEEVQEYIDSNQSYWLDNEYLEADAESVSFIVSDSDLVIGKYLLQTSEVKIEVFTVAQDGDDTFEFGRTYPSEIYNLHEVDESHTWNVFSYEGYDGTEYTGAVLAIDNVVCEITFKNCDEEMISHTLVAYQL